MNKKQPSKKTIRAIIRGSVPDGKLKGARIVLSDKPGQDIGGFTEYASGKGVVKIATPAGMRASDLTVRGHETRHATFHGARKRKAMTEREIMCAQMIDDVNIESKPLPAGISEAGLREYRRAHLATAMRDVARMRRTQARVKAGTQPDSIERRNGDLLCSTRALSMLKNYGVGISGARFKGISKIGQLIGADSLRAINTIVAIAKSSRKRATAISMLLSMLESEDTPDMEDEELPPSPKGDILSPVSHGDALEGKMEILDLRPKSVYCAKEKQVTSRHAPHGVIINPTRYVSAVVSGNAEGLFRRQVRQEPGGTVVIDASGSMGTTKRNLSELCKLIPTATVAYYSGREHARGILAIYSFQGKRFNGVLPQDTLRGGNSVDLAAVKWLMQHPKPWTFVSDLEFCGGTLGSEIVAKALIERAKARGNLELHMSLQAAFEAFGGKGELPGRYDPDA